MPAILATEATLSTLQVEIKALSVKGKQMTLAVFRQLPQKDAFDGSSLVQGAAYWGVVHYPVKNEDKRWFIVVCDDILYRCPGSCYTSTRAIQDNL